MKNISSFALTGFLAIILLTSIATPSIWADSKLDENTLKKLEKIEAGFEKIRAGVLEQRTDNISSMVFEFRNIGTMLIDIQSSISWDERDNIKSQYEGLHSSYKKLTTKNEQIAKQLSAHEKKLIQKLSKDTKQIELKLKKFDEKQQKINFVKSELQRLDEDKEYKKLFVKMYQQEYKGGYASFISDKVFSLTIDELISSGNLKLLPYALEHQAKQYPTNSAELLELSDDIKKMLADQKNKKIIPQINPIPIESNPDPKPTDPKPTDPEPIEPETPRELTKAEQKALSKLNSAIAREEKRELKYQLAVEKTEAARLATEEAKERLTNAPEGSKEAKKAQKALEKTQKILLRFLTFEDKMEQKLEVAKQKVITAEDRFNEITQLQSGEINDDKIAQNDEISENIEAEESIDTDMTDTDKDTSEHETDVESENNEQIEDNNIESDIENDVEDIEINDTEVEETDVESNDSSNKSPDDNSDEKDRDNDEKGKDEKSKDKDEKSKDKDD